MARSKPKVKLTKFDPVDYLKTEKDLVLYLEAGLAEGGDDRAFIAGVLNDIARAHAKMSRPKRHRADNAAGRA